MNERRGDRGDATCVPPEQSRELQASELERFIAESTAARAPSEAEAREALSDALRGVEAAYGTEELAPALRRLSRAALALARVVSR